MSTLIDELSWRGMLQDATDGAGEHLATPGRTLYIGFDPTADSLHVGSLLPIMVLVRAQRAGHHPIALVGGATGLIGDPSFKNRERPLLSRADMEANALGIRAQLEHFLDFDAPENPARMRNNLDWLGRTNVLDFLRDVGKHFSVNAMLRKESVRRRVESDEQGISFTEFSYQLLQAADFLHLYREDGCTVQAGGSDQWGNITAGTELVRRVAGGHAFGVTSPLVTTAAGTKFGKTEAGTVWLDAKRTSPFRFYQFWVNCADADVGRYLRYFTFLSRDEIEELDRATEAEPWRRRAQKALAEEVTRRVHGEAGLAGALKATEALFGGSLEGLSAAEIADIFSEVPSSTVSRDALGGDAGGIVALLAETTLATSKGDARRSVQGGGVYLNGIRVDDVDAHVTPQDAVEGRFVVLRKGKKRYHLVELV
jgi:tyrosyl-tRNA synthetase